MAGIDQTARRPAPEALLVEAAAEGRGKLKIFLGAAPGVGKTYEMLSSGAERHREGADVVVGIVETHGRAETERLARGLETLPRARVSYKGRILEEMDIDAVLARRPSLVLVDELAHTNAPGSRHPKRYQDVEELLDVGIDVYTTLNVQHVESLNDVVAQITRIRVRETVPDSIIDRADEIEVVDVTPEVLIQRLHEGKVYVRDAAQRALKHYFSPGNLTALRELALRRTAQRVDEQMLNYMRAHAIAGPWPTDERLLVCIDGGPASTGLVRYARRSADRLRCNWAAIHVETLGHVPVSEAERDRLSEAFRLAEKLGGKAVMLSGDHVADTILDYARENNVTQIVLGRPAGGRFLAAFRPTLVGSLIRNAGMIGIHVVPGDAGSTERAIRTRAVGDGIDPMPYAVSTLTIGLAIVLGRLIQLVAPLPNISLVFLAAILFTAVNYGLWPSLFASLLSTLAYNFFFLPPLYTFTITDPANVLALIFFTVVAVLTSNLTARTRRQIVVAQAQIKTTTELNSFSRKLAGINDLDDLLWAASFQIASMLKLRVVFLFPADGHMSVAAGYPPDDVADEADLAAARWAFDHQCPAGRGSNTLPGAKRLFLPIRTASGMLAVVGLDREAPGPLFTADEGRLLDALLDQIAVSIERIRLAEDIDNARVMSETERLRGALLTSISHDLRTPLASIIGAVSSLRSYFDRYDAKQRGELIATIEDEAERLNRFVGNLLDITRLEAGALNIRADRVEIGELVETALRRAARLLARHRVEVDLSPDLPPVRADSVLLEQVIFNLLDNAAKYSGPGSLVRISAERAHDEVLIRVSDEGEGIPPDEIEHIFDKFHRVRAGDQRPAGTGLGLAVCRGFVEAFGGRITAANRTDRRGAQFTVMLPAAMGGGQP
ncbi:MAG TPA: sensor histidine kinase KdpD [Parvibaculum sp.]|uniref:sensor histidine kinase KdpD n=1 Tax=Parvibaculum sp. TaxID=2024848 RepID=UPI002B731AF1|nr:sensor histidine kinase KdpD [Parvibaculum sp.]HMM14832.1 sensor histidine kinase KdpD [Parvibaculum sp.]